VPAQSGNWRVVSAALAQLPPGITQRYLRGDAGCYEHELLDNLEREQVGYAISAPMSRELAARIAELEEGSGWSWGASATRCVSGPRSITARAAASGGTWRSGAQDPGHPVRRRLGPAPLRGGEQPGLGGRADHPLAPREGGTIEHAHDVLKNGLAAGCFPSGKFGANAAWVRLNAMLYNLLSLLKRETLPGEFTLPSRSDCALSYSIPSVDSFATLARRSCVSSAANPVPPRPLQNCHTRKNPAANRSLRSPTGLRRENAKLTGAVEVYTPRR